MTNETKIETVLLSVTDKSGLIDFAKDLLKINPKIQFIASGNTGNLLRSANILVKAIEEHTQFPECFGGRLKTLHPKIAGGILMRRGIDDSESESYAILPIDMVVCNLYDFSAASKDKHLEMNQLVESMDIGGSTLIRAACKNYSDVAVIVSPCDYQKAIDVMKTHHGKVTMELKKKFAVKAINYSANYEAMLAKEFSLRLDEVSLFHSLLKNGKSLRYGENPDQKAWVYQFESEFGLPQSQSLSGKELSYNNYEDASCAYRAAKALHDTEFKNGVVIVKHGSVCGLAASKKIKDAFKMAWESDSKSAFGSVVCFCEPLDTSFIEDLEDKYIEVIISPDFSKDFLHWVKDKKKNVRLIKMPIIEPMHSVFKSIPGGMLIQTEKKFTISELFLDLNEGRGIASKRKPNKIKEKLFQFGLVAVSFAKSNAIAIVRELGDDSYQTLSMGVGQPNRVDCIERLAIPKAIEKLRMENEENSAYDPAQDLGQCVMASDGFFPFPDSINYAAQMGIKSIVQPGGSIKDQEVIQASDDHDLCMVLTGERYFYH